VHRLVSIVLALGLVALSAGVALVGALWGFELKCDDSCSTAPGWREDPNAWQWNALGWAGIGAFVCSLVVLGGIVSRRRILASLALVTWTVVGIGFLTLFRGAGLTSHPGRGWVGLAAVSATALLAIALTPRDRFSE
jgi:hypothetical protein